MLFSDRDIVQYNRFLPKESAVDPGHSTRDTDRLNSKVILVVHSLYSAIFHRLCRKFWSLSK